MQAFLWRHLVPAQDLKVLVYDPAYQPPGKRIVPPRPTPPVEVPPVVVDTNSTAGAMAGAAGLLYLETFGTTRYDAGFQLGLMAFTAAVLGGIGNLKGAVVGGFIIGLIQAWNDGLPHGLGQQWSQSVVFTILILLMVFKPEGLYGNPTVEKV